MGSNSLIQGPSKDPEYDECLQLWEYSVANSRLRPSNHLVPAQFSERTPSVKERKIFFASQIGKALLMNLTAIPAELVKCVLLEGLGTDDEGAIARTVAMFVCRQWHGLLKDRSKKHPLLPGPEFSVAAAEFGHLGLLKWARTLGCPLTIFSMLSASRFGRMEVLKWLREQGCNWDFRCCELAALGGHLEVLKWFHDQGCRLGDRAGAFAAASGDLEILQWVWERLPSLWGPDTFRSAAKAGNIKMLEWLRDQKADWDTNVLTSAAEGDKSEAVLWLLDNGCPRNDDEFPAATAAVGNLSLLKTLKERGVKFTQHTLALAVLNGRKEVVEWLREQGCDYGDMVLRCAAQKGDLDTMKWLVEEKGCSLHQELSDLAAMKNHIQVLKWLREKHLAWDISTFHNAAFNGKAEAARWCIDNGCPLDEVAPETAALGGNLPLLQMLVKERGLPLPTTISASVGVLNISLSNLT